jgi:hypothetical protein
MNKRSLFIIIIFLISISVIPGHSTIKKLAQTGLQFLEIDINARAAAMGGAYIMIGQDATAMFYNPAGVARMQSNFDVIASRTQWFADISYSAGGIAKNFGSWGTVGLSFITADYGEIIGTRVASTEKGFTETGSVDVGAYVVGLTYAKGLTEKFTVGGQVKYASQHLGENLLSDGTTVNNEVSGLAFDFGTIFYPGFKSFRFGMSIRNFSPEFKYQQEGFQLPLTFLIGFGMDMLDFLGEHENSSLLLGIDAQHPRDYTERVHVGLEYTYQNLISLRGGYKYNYDEEGLTAGVGFNIQSGNLGFKVGYSYSEFGVFDGINRFDVGFTF